MEKEISIVTTCHPDSGIMGDFYNAVERLADENEISLELIVVSDVGIKGDSSIREFSSPKISCHVVSSTERSSQAAAIIQGFRAATADAILSIDPDMAQSLYAALGMLDALAAGSEVVVTRRLFRGRSFFRSVCSLVFNLVISFIFGYRVHDINSPMFMIRRSVIRGLSSSRLPEEAYKLKLFMDYKGAMKEISVLDDSPRYEISSTYGYSLLALLFVKRIWLALRLRSGLV